jgi:L-alanine-DL-glutamate epimerase-like enolase superfamily enzyme
MNTHTPTHTDEAAIARVFNAMMDAALAEIYNPDTGECHNIGETLEAAKFVLASLVTRCSPMSPSEIILYATLVAEDLARLIYHGQKELAALN